MNPIDQPAHHQTAILNQNNEVVSPSHYFAECQGLTIRQYAAIHLQVEDSGIPELDAMIRKARRDRFATETVNGLISASAFTNLPPLQVPAAIAAVAHDFADAMLSKGGE